jgi:hypothetical protein
VIVWKGIQEILMIVINIYYINKYDCSEIYDEDVKMEAKRHQRLGHITPYEGRYYKTLKYPESSIKWSNFIRIIQVVYTVAKGFYRLTAPLAFVTQGFSQCVIRALSTVLGI